MTAADPLWERVEYDCRMSNGTMPIVMVVRDEDERRRAVALLCGNRRGKLITVRTRAEVDAEREKLR